MTLPAYMLKPSRATRGWPQLFDGIMKTIIGRHPGLTPRFPVGALVLVIAPEHDAAMYSVVVRDTDLIPWARDLIAQYPGGLRQHPGADAVIAITPAY